MSLSVSLPCFCILGHAFLFFSFIFISWRLITLQYCSGFCHTLTWISGACIPKQMAVSLWRLGFPASIDVTLDHCMLLHCLWGLCILIIFCKISLLKSRNLKPIGGCYSRTFPLPYWSLGLHSLSRLLCARCSLKYWEYIENSLM